MYPALNAWTFPDALPPADQLSEAAHAGFAGIELVLAETGPLRPDTPLREFSGLARQAASLDLRITSLATGMFWERNYACPRGADRQRAVDLTLHLLDRAAAAHAGAVLVVPAVVGRPDDPHLLVPYADALYRTCDALLTLRHEADARGVIIAIENVWNQFLLSPMEMCDLLDHVSSPYVRAYLDIGNVLAYGYPQDWITLLGGRIARVHVKDYDLSRPGWAGFCPLGEGDVDWPAVIAALRAVGYDGPLTYEGAGEPAQICRRLQAILADAGAPAEECT